MIKETLAALDLHFKRANSVYAEIKQFENELNSEVFDNPEKIKTIDAFILRYIKIQDLMGDKLFKELLISVGDYKSNMTFLDTLDKLEKLELIQSASSWMIYRNLRNTLIHEYPDNEKEILQGIQAFFKCFFRNRKSL